MNSEFAIQLKWKSDTRQTASRWVLSHVLRHKLQIVVLLIGAIGNATGASIMFVMIGQAFNAVSAQPINYPLLSGAAWGIVLSQIIRGVLQLGRNFGSEVIGQRLERDARHELYASLIGKSMTFHDQQSVGDVMARATNDVREINLMLNPGLNLVVGSFMFMVLPLFVAPSIYPSLIVTPLLFAIVYFILLQQLLHQLRPATESVRRQFGGMNAILAESIEGIETVKGAAQEDQAIEKFEAGARKYRDAYVAQARIEARFLPFLWLAIITGAALA
ncbi:MAG TPA: ABC transporter ATP-binding protein, partial [Anaerolineae bacterium]|nr:ABC transporter ATP-binding protein [Anaerolineae bacterium]